MPLNMDGTIESPELCASPPIASGQEMIVMVPRSGLSRKPFALHMGYLGSTSNSIIQ
jgi:hypothetical protein